MTLTHVAIRIMAEAIRACPEINGVILGRNLYLRDSVDVCALVALDGGRDLSAAKLPDTDTLSVVDIARVLQEKASRIRRHKDPELQRTQRMLARLSCANVGRMMRLLDFLVYRVGLDLEWAGVPRDQFGSAVVTSVGMLGIDLAYVPLVPITHVPLFVLLGEVSKRPAVVGDQVVPRDMVTITCTFDHRFIDGSQAAVLARITRESFQRPERLLLPAREAGAPAAP